MRDSVSFKSSDSDVSDVSAMSNASDTRPVRRIRAGVMAGAPLTKSSSVGGEICSLGKRQRWRRRKRHQVWSKMGMVGLGKERSQAPPSSARSVPVCDIQIGMVYRKERLDVEVIRARGLVGKQGNKNTPAPYVKVYLMDNEKSSSGRLRRMDHKSFMGALSDLLDDLDLSNIVIGWFKLFPATSLVDPALAP
ncbi:regulating synaptic membrane exocytosis protein 2-like isoform X11 [Lates japonicus]|uniref:Regulating synaptic membrane exocytosis protein 2-like isoform X11 n=1 Tax=Lates japonicus TaxID=270547 RepID=A0AAD3NB43_LATJO|nr:regulating synaptic membrane exocytosis protein 2-like isoform X11 [Lates japonicus]